MCIPPISIAFIALFINGTDYFVGGMLALVTGPIAYCIFKRKYGGLTKTDPVRNPVNPKTRLGIGDTRRLTWMFGCLTVIGIIAMFFLPWYEDPQAYTDDYGIEGLFDILMITKSSITDAKWLGLEWEGYAFVGLIFWILCFSMSRYSQWLERRLDTDRRS